MNFNMNSVFLIAALSAAIMMARAEEPGSLPPDLTQSTAVDRKETYNLGATGLRGWILPRPQMISIANKAEPPLAVAKFL